MNLINPVRSKLVSSAFLYKEVLRKHAPPCPMGTCIASHSVTDNKLIIGGGWHGSDLDLWRDQISKGFVDMNEYDLYIADQELAAHYAYGNKTPILLRLQMLTGTLLCNESFGTYYVNQASNPKIIIHSVYHLSDNYKRYRDDHNRPGCFYVHTLAFKKAFNHLISSDIK